MVFDYHVRRRRRRFGTFITVYMCRERGLFTVGVHETLVMLLSISNIERLP